MLLLIGNGSPWKDPVPRASTAAHDRLIASVNRPDAAPGPDHHGYRNGASDGSAIGHRNASQCPNRRETKAICEHRACADGPREHAELQGFRPCSRGSGPRLKIVVSPVRVRVSPFQAPESRMAVGFSSYRWTGARAGGPCTRNGRRVPGSSAGPRRTRNARNTGDWSDPGGRFLVSIETARLPFPAFFGMRKAVALGSSNLMSNDV